MTPPENGWRTCVAPMLQWTDRHCRYFHRLLSRHTRLYTEMIHTGALLHGDVRRHLLYSACEHPLALQLGGSDPLALAACARLAQQWGYDEVNLNCGCPSDRVQQGAFGACLMKSPRLVADCVAAMRDAASVDITVKHRIGLDRDESYSFVRDFVGEVSRAGCSIFIVHARNAWLQGLSPKENRDIPPLRHEVPWQLKRDFPQLRIIVNGGITTTAQMQQQLRHVDGVMIGREAYHNPWWLHEWDSIFYDDAPRSIARETVMEQMLDYMEQQQRDDAAPWYAIARHILGLYHGQPHARRWRQVWSDHRLKPLPARQIQAMLTSTGDG